MLFFYLLKKCFFLGFIDVDTENMDAEIVDAATNEYDYNKRFISEEEEIYIREKTS
jgi:hypothetical protein